MAAVRGGVKHHVRRAAFDAPLQHGLQGLVGGIVLVEGKVIAKHNKAVRGGAQVRQALRQGGNVLAMDLDQLEIGLAAGAAKTQGAPHLRLRRLDEGGFAHAARAPQ
jgi:hypothetical protein